MILPGFLDFVDYPNKTSLLVLADYVLMPMHVAFQGREIHVPSDDPIHHHIHSIAIRAMAGLVGFMLLPLTLAAFAVKWLKSDEWRTVAEQPLDILDDDLLPDDEESSQEDSILSRQVFQSNLTDEFSRCHLLDVKLEPPAQGSWRKYGEQNGEYNQTLDNYLKMHQKCEWPDHRPLVIQKIGDFSPEDLKVIDLTIEFLTVFHQVEIDAETQALTMQHLKEKYLAKIKGVPEEESGMPAAYIKHLEKRAQTSFPRENGQYDAVYALDMMSSVLKPKFDERHENGCKMIGFTSEDLFTQDLRNFVFGCAYLHNGVGIWSNSRFGNPSDSSKSFEKCLIRMMKISAHEFGHMRSIPHCTDYECNIGGYMSLTELDNRPLLYCLQDTAKICSLSDTSLLKYHKNLRTFFTKFNQKHGLRCDFSKEIKTLDERIAILSKK